MGEDGGEDAYRDPDHGGVGLDPCLVVFAHEAEGADETGDEQLDGQDRIDLADELVSDVDGGFSNGSAELEGTLLAREERWSCFEGSAYLEVIGDLALAVPRGTAKEEGIVLSRAALGLVRGRRLRVGIRVVLRSGRVLCRARHGCDVARRVLRV